MSSFIEGFSVFGVKHYLHEITFDLCSTRWPISFHFTEAEANQALAEFEKTEHEFDELHVAPDSQYDP